MKPKNLFFHAEIARIFFKLGLTLFGGPAAHVAAFEKEFVQKRRWLNEEEFRAHFAVANLLPGPTSTEMALALGFQKGGWPGFFSAGLGFTAPSVVLTVALVAILPLDTPLMVQFAMGAGPVLAAILLKAVWDLGKRTERLSRSWWMAALPFCLNLLGFSQWAALCLGASLVLFRRKLHQWGVVAISLLMLPWFFTQVLPNSLHSSPSVASIFSVFTYLGAMVFGSGYVLLGFLDQIVHRDLQWLTSQQVIWTSLVAQVTPGPLFSAASGAGYLVGSWPGALAATLGVFLPGFALAAMAAPFHRKMMSNPTARSLADVLSLLSLLFLALSVFHLLFTLVAGWKTWGILLVALALLFRGLPGGVLVLLGGGAYALSGAFF